MEVCGEDVSKGDTENITVLHWAAINNRISVASYFIQVSIVSECHLLAPSSQLCMGVAAERSQSKCGWWRAVIHSHPLGYKTGPSLHGDPVAKIWCKSRDVGC